MSLTSLLFVALLAPAAFSHPHQEREQHNAAHRSFRKVKILTHDKNTPFRISAVYSNVTASNKNSELGLMMDNNTFIALEFTVKQKVSFVFAVVEFSFVRDDEPKSIRRLLTHLDRVCPEDFEERYVCFPSSATHVTKAIRVPEISQFEINSPAPVEYFAISIRDSEDNALARAVVAAHIDFAKYLVWDD